MRKSKDDEESDAESRSWSEELQKELPANGRGGEDTISGLEGWLASADCCEGVFCVCAEKADAEFRSWSEELQMQKVRLSCCTNPMMLEVMRNEDTV